MQDMGEGIIVKNNLPDGMTFSAFHGQWHAKNASYLFPLNELEMFQQYWVF